MTTLSKAPLLEVVTQIRWGVAERNQDGELVQFVFSDAESSNLPEELERAFNNAGFVHVEVFAPEQENVQFVPVRRYRRDPDGWPIYQSGLGVLSVNQRNDEYDWQAYKEDVLRGIEILSDALRGFHDDIPFIGVELGYVDGFPVEEDQPFLQFLQEKFRVTLSPPEEFLSAPFVDPRPTSASLSIDLRITEPRGLLICSLDPAEFMGRSGYVMETLVRSLGDAVEYSREGLGLWLEAAHRVQQHTFSTLIEPAYMKSFQ